MTKEQISSDNLLSITNNSYNVKMAIPQTGRQHIAWKGSVEDIWSISSWSLDDSTIKTEHTAIQAWQQHLWPYPNQLREQTSQSTDTVKNDKEGTRHCLEFIAGLKLKYQQVFEIIAGRHDINLLAVGSSEKKKLGYVEDHSDILHWCIANHNIQQHVHKVHYDTRGTH